MTKKLFLESAYELKNDEQTQTLYRDWAASYDEEISANGYASPRRTAEALSQCGARFEQPLLDIGCGSGVSGQFLRQAGFCKLHGCDFSQPMLALAESKNIYLRLHHSNLNAPFHFVDSPYNTITAIGVMAPGHAGPDLLESTLKLMTVGGFFGFSMNDHTLEDPGFMQAIDTLVKARKIRIRWSEYGEHLPGIGLNSLIMVIERLR